MPPKKNRIQLLLAALCLLAIGLATWFARRPDLSTSTTATPSDQHLTNLSSSNLILEPPASTNASELQKIFAALPNADAKTAAQQLAALRAALAAMPDDQAVAAIKKFLDSKADAPTHLGFKIGENGLLTQAPTLRTFLLDELARLDPSAAADYAKIILASKDSPDEWAIALRNLARGDASDDGRALLEQKTTEMLQYEPWQQNPSVGFLEAFDAAVYLGGTSLMPTLTDLVKRQDNPAVAHASYLALDRLAINNPATTLNALLADPDSMQGRELTRADYFARANPGDPDQRQILENYLLNPQIGRTEIDAFLAIFPNANFMLSPNLLTQTPLPDRAALTERDAASLNAVQQWLVDPRFAAIYPSLEKAKSRLEGFVREAGGQ